MDQTYEKYDMMNAAGIGGCMSAAVSGEYLYVISNRQQYVPEDRTGGCLRVMTLRDPASICRKKRIFRAMTCGA